MLVHVWLKFAKKMWKNALAIVLCVTIFSYAMFILLNGYQKIWYEKSAPCVTPKHIMDEMVNLTFDVYDILTRHKIPNVLCYGTLWGALRYGQTLPWDNNVDFCVLKHEVEKMPWETLLSTFKDRRMDISYDYYNGEYNIIKGSAKAILNVFYVSNNEVLQDGFKHRFLGLFQDSTVSFPHRLLQAPFKQIPFHDHLLPVPHDDIEILKYLYKENWWTFKAPPGCKIQ